MSSYGMNTSTLLMRLLDHERALEREREQREAAAMQNMMRVTAAKQAEEKHTLEQKLKQAQLEGNYQSNWDGRHRSMNIRKWRKRLNLGAWQPKRKGRLPREPMNKHSSELLLQLDILDSDLLETQ